MKNITTMLGIIKGIENVIHSQTVCVYFMHMIITLLSPLSQWNESRGLKNADSDMETLQPLFSEGTLTKQAF